MQSILVCVQSTGHCGTTVGLGVGADLGLLNLRSPVLNLGMRQLLRFQGSFQLALQAPLCCFAGIHSL